MNNYLINIYYYNMYNYNIIYYKNKKIKYKYYIQYNLYELNYK